MANKAEMTSHLDGYMAFPEVAGNHKLVIIRLCVGGKPIVGEEFQVASYTTDVEQDRALALADALCLFMNTGGDRDALFLITDRFVTRTKPIIGAGYTLVSVLAPASGNMVLWKRPDGSYLRVVYGSEGFSESLSEEEAKQVLVESTMPIDDEDMP